MILKIKDLTKLVSKNPKAYRLIVWIFNTCSYRYVIINNYKGSNQKIE